MFRHLQSPIHLPPSQVSGRSLPSHERGGGFSCFQEDQPVFLHPSPSCLYEVSLPDTESAHQGAHPSSQGEAGTGRSPPWGQPPWGSGGEGPGTWAEPGLCGSWACTPRAEVGPGSCLGGKGADGKSRPSWSWCVAPPELGRGHSTGSRGVQSWGWGGNFKGNMASECSECQAGLPVTMTAQK